MLLLLHHWRWLFLNGLEVQFLSAGKIVILIIARYDLGSGLLALFLLLSDALNERLVYPIHGVHHLLLVAGVVGLLELAVGLAGLGLLGVADVAEIGGLDVAAGLFDLEAVVPHVPEGQIFVMVLRVVGLVSLIGVVILLLIEVGGRHRDIIIGELASLKLQSSVDVVIAEVLGLVVVVHIVLLVFLLPQLAELLVLDEGLVVLEGLRLVFYEVALLGLLVAHRIYNLNLFINDIRKY